MSKNIMFEKSIDLIFTNLSKTIRLRKEELGRTREDIFPDNQSLVSNVTNNNRNERYPNMMSEKAVQCFADALNFKDRAEMLWGNINWNLLYETAINEIYSYAGSNGEMKALKKMLINALIEDISFAEMRATIDFGFYNNDDTDSDQTFHKAVHQLDSRYKYVSKQPATENSITIKMEHEFHKQFDENRLVKFTVRFPRFLFDFFVKVLEPLRTSDNSNGSLTYQLVLNAYNSIEEQGLRWLDNDKKGIEHLEKILKQLQKAINAIRRIQQYEDQWATATSDNN